MYEPHKNFNVNMQAMFSEMQELGMTAGIESWLEKVLVKTENVQSDKLDGKLVLYKPAETCAVYLNESAALVWDLCDGARRIADILEMLGEAYPGSLGAIRNDVESALQPLLDNGFIEFNAE